MTFSILELTLFTVFSMLTFSLGLALRQILIYRKTLVILTEKFVKYEKDCVNLVASLINKYNKEGTAVTMDQLKNMAGGSDETH